MKNDFFELKVQTVRIHDAPDPITQPTTSPADYCHLWHAVVAASPWYDSDKECLVVFTIDARLFCTGFFLVSLGALTETSAQPREIFKPVIGASAAGFILAHNHPSGDPSPSEADRRLTRRIREAGELLSIQLVDHLIIATAPRSRPDLAPYFSFREHGLV